MPNSPRKKTAAVKTERVKNESMMVLYELKA